LAVVLASPDEGDQKGALVSALLATAIATRHDVGGVIRKIAAMGEQEIEPWQFGAVAELQRSLGRRGITLREYFANAPIDQAEVRQTMQNIYAKARDYALGETAPDADVRLAAIQLMGGGLNDLSENLSVLLDLIDAQTEVRLMIAVVDVLKRGKDPLIGDQVVARWKRAPPSIRPRLLDLLLRRSPWTETLVEALEQNHISSRTLPAEVRQRLLTQADEVIAKRAEALFAHGLAKDRMEVVKRYGEVAGMSGNALHGGEVFKTNCSVCHVFVGLGQSVGPALNDFRSKPVEDLLLAIFNPNAAIESSYTGYLLTLKDGSSLAGVIKEESPGSFTLMLPGNVSQVVLRSDVAEIKALETSFMPEGLEATLTLQDMADLFSYISEAEGAVGPGRD
jgi:putative heme-binding domain-containing protein